MLAVHPYPKIHPTQRFTKCPFFLTHSLPLSSSPSPSFKITCSAAEERSEIRLGLPSKGRMAADTLDLLKDCQLSVKHVNPRQYVAKIPELSNLEVWFQRPKDIVRKLLSGDLDLGIAGLDTVREYERGSEDLIIVHDALGYGECHLSLANVKLTHIFRECNMTADALAKNSITHGLGLITFDNPAAHAAQAFLDDLSAVTRARRTGFCTSC